MHAIGHLFTILIIQPIFNVLVLIYAILPGHNFGLAVILFTILARLALWPLVKKQLHHTRIMQQLQPELKKIKKAAKGDKQKESRMVMEMYKERGINPFASIGLILAQFPILFALWRGLLRIAKDPQQIISFSYSWTHHLSWMKQLGSNIHRFDDSLFGVVNLTDKAFSHGKVYWPAILIAAASAVAQYYQSRQLLPKNKDSRSLRDILGGAGKGQAADQQEVNAAAQQTMIIFVPALVFLAALQFPAALPLYWLVNSSVAWFQQSRILNRDVQEMEVEAEEPEPATPKKKVAPKPKTKKRAAKNNRRKRR